MSPRSQALLSASCVKGSLSKDFTLEPCSQTFADSEVPARHCYVKERLNHPKRVAFDVKIAPSKWSLIVSTRVETFNMRH